MKQKKFSLYIVIAIVAVLLIGTILTYNSLVAKQEKTTQQWNEVQNAYQRRNDLVPNLVNVVKGGADFEQTTLQQVIAARAKAASVTVSSNANADDFVKQSAAQDELAAVTNRMLIRVENYPDLKGTRAFKDLQVQLEGTERRIKVARKDFNEAVYNYNSSVKSFPTKLVAGLLGFKPLNGFSADAGAEKTVEINF